MTASKRDGASKPEPLTPAVFHILLALADGPKHGYAIMKQVDAEGAGSLRMGPGTLYGTLQRMLAAALVSEIPAEEMAVEEITDAGNGEAADARRRYYRLTGAGRRSLQHELARLQQALKAARKKGWPLRAQQADQ